MLKNYFKMAWRSITRHTTYAFINILGLALGITACLVIYLIIHFELSFDTFHPDKERIYCIDGEARNGSGETRHWNAVYAPLPFAMRAEMSGLETVAAFHRYGFKVSIPDGNKPAKKLGDGSNIIIAEPQYFSIFKYKWLAGNAATSLNKPFKVVLTESTARKYFGTGPLDNMMGKTIAYDDSLQVSVSGIIKDWDQHTDLGFTDFISFSTIKSSFLKNEVRLEDWGWLKHSSQAFVKLAKGVSVEQINAQFATLLTRHGQEAPGPHFGIGLKPLTGMHFNADYGGDYYRKAHLPTLYALMGIALFILVIAVINFINLSTALSLQRVKEIGVRKVLGSGRAGLVFQFLTETFVLTLFAVLLALLLIKPVLAAFASFIPDGVQFHFSDAATWIFLLLLTLFTSLLAGFYPARVLSGYLPVLSLKGADASKGSEKWYLRKGLIVFQFTISLMFIIGALVIGNQIRFMRTKDLGFRTDAIVTLRSLWNHDGHMNVLAEKIRQLPSAEKVILEAFPPMGFAHMENSVVYKGKNEIQIQASEQVSNEDFIPFYQMKLLAGRNLLHSDSLTELVINEACSRALGFTQPQEAIGKFLCIGGGNRSFPIAGVVADFHENSFHERIGPVYIAHEPEYENGIAIRLATKGRQASDVKALLSKIEQLWKESYPAESFSYAFLDESIARLYETEQKTATLVNVSMFITIFISCMGLFGLALFTAAKRTKEIGIRKVLGASVVNIAGLLMKDFVVLIAIAIVIAFPIAWYFMRNWLQDFVYRTTIHWWVFALAGLAAVFVGLLTIGVQAIRAAVANPVKSLRTDG